jgi:hypothetical protein
MDHDDLNDDDAVAKVEAAWNAELARRAVEIISGTVRGESAEKVIANIRAKYSKQ